VSSPPQLESNGRTLDQKNVIRTARQAWRTSAVVGAQQLFRRALLKIVSAGQSTSDSPKKKRPGVHPARPLAVVMGRNLRVGGYFPAKPFPLSRL